MIETLQAENVALKTRGAAADHDGERLHARLAKVENQLDRFRAEGFWNRVMHEVAEILTHRGALPPAEILPELRTWTVRGAAPHKEPPTPGMLKKKIDVRVSFGRYFESRDEGHYARKAG